MYVCVCVCVCVRTCTRLCVFVCVCVGRGEYNQDAHLDCSRISSHDGKRQRIPYHMYTSQVKNHPHCIGILCQNTHDSVAVVLCQDLRFC